MQTFMPYSDIKKSVECLDYKRLGKQRVEAMQTKYGTDENGDMVIEGEEEYPDALAYYHNMCIDEWIKRGYNNTMKHIVHVKDFKRPEWIGDERIHKSHRSNLLRKDYEFYSQYGWNEPTNIEYYWVD